MAQEQFDIAAPYTDNTGMVSSYEIETFIKLAWEIKQEWQIEQVTAVPVVQWALLTKLMLYTLL